jgi:hypothetical protein
MPDTLDARVKRGIYEKNARVKRAKRGLNFFARRVADGQLDPHTFSLSAQPAR